MHTISPIAKRTHAPFSRRVYTTDSVNSYPINEGA